MQFCTFSPKIAHFFQNADIRNSVTRIISLVALHIVYLNQAKDMTLLLYKYHDDPLTNYQDLEHSRFDV